MDGKPRYGFALRQHTKASAFDFYLLGILLVGILITNQDRRLIHAAQISETQNAEIDQKATALYADAANFQRGQAYDIAIESWTAFLDNYPQSKLATSASYYLGVCYMQKTEPDYEAAVTAFERTLKVDDFDLRQESLANLAWCLYQQGIAGVAVNSSLLQKSLSVLDELIDSKPSDLQIGQALFYSGEICYRLGDQNRAISFYDQFLSSQSAESPLWVDALYGKGVAQEESKQNTKAIKTYSGLVKSNPDSRLTVDVRIRLGDLHILDKNFTAAIEQFRLASQTTELDTDRSYAIFREAFSLVQLNQYEEASKRYSELIANYPDSSLAQPAQLAKAQSFYRAGKTDLAEIEFEIIRQGDDLSASTEAVHWLARIKLSQGKNDEAVAITSAQIAEGLEGEFSIPVRLDLADAMAAGKTSEDKTKAKEQYYAIYNESANHPLAPRSLFNAAVLSLQLANPREALSYSDQFLEAFPSTNLRLEITYIKAESHNQLDELELASAAFSQLVSITPADHPQKSEWILRAANTWNSAGKADKTIAMLAGNPSLFTKANPKTESLLLMGQAYRSLSKFEEAVEALEESLESARDEARKPEILLTLGLALKDSKQTQEALSTLQALIKDHPISEFSQQARYQLASIFRDQRRFDESIALYDQILQSSDSQELLTYARYGKGWCLMQSNQYGSVIETLSPLLAGPDNPVSFDARLTRGIAYRESNDYSSAMKDFEACLKIADNIEQRGKALLEISLAHIKTLNTEKAVPLLCQIVEDFPQFSEAEVALHELGWAYKDTNQIELAVQTFKRHLDEYPNSPRSVSSAYFLGQQLYASRNYQEAIDNFKLVIQNSEDRDLLERAYYRMAWSLYHEEQFDQAETFFSEQSNRFEDGPLSFDALMMIAECRYQRQDFQSALEAYKVTRARIIANDESAKNLPDPSERQVREIALLHGGQSAAQLEQWSEAIQWYDELRDRFPSTIYLAEVFYESGFAHQRLGNNSVALELLNEVASNYRNEIAARARFMIGEIYFGDDKLELAIPEFQRVMFGFGSENAPASIKNWQAKSGFEAGRCSELLIVKTRTANAKQKAKQIAIDFYEYVIDKHPNHDLAATSRERLEVIQGE